MSYAWSPLPDTVENRLSLSQDAYVTAELGFIRAPEEMVRRRTGSQDDLLSLKSKCDQLQQSLRHSENVRYTIENANSNTAEAALIAQQNLEIAEKKRVELIEQLNASKREKEVLDSQISALIAEDENKTRIIEKLQTEARSVKDQLHQTQEALFASEESLYTAKTQIKELETILRQREQAAGSWRPLLSAPTTAEQSARVLYPGTRTQSMNVLQNPSQDPNSRGQRSSIFLPFDEDVEMRTPMQDRQIDRSFPRLNSNGTGTLAHSADGQRRQVDPGDASGLVSSLLALEEEKRRAAAHVAALQDELLRARFQAERAEADRDAAIADVRAARSAADGLRQDLHDSETARLSLEATLSARSATPSSASDAAVAQEEIAALLGRLREAVAQRVAAERRASALEAMQRQMQETIDAHALEAVSHANQMDMLAGQADFLADHVKEVHAAKEAVEARLADSEARLSNLSAYFLEIRACHILGRIAAFVRLWRRFAALRAWRVWRGLAVARRRREHGLDRGMRLLSRVALWRAMRRWDRICAHDRRANAEDERRREDAAARRALEETAQEAQRMHEVAVSALAEARAEDAARRIRAFLRFWMTSGPRRAWNKWIACTFERAARKQRRLRLLRLALQKMRGGDLARAFGLWMGQVHEARERALAEGAAQAHAAQLSAVLEERAAQDARLAALEVAQAALRKHKEEAVQQMERVARERDHLLAQTQEQRVNLAVGRTLAFLRYWKNATIIRAWNKWRDCTWTRAGVRRRRLHLVRLSLRKLMRGAVAGWFVTWADAVHSSKADARRREADSALQELMAAREARLAAEEHAAVLQSSQERTERAWQEACNRIEELDQRLTVAQQERAGVLESLEHLRVTIATGRTLAFLRFWRNSSVSRAWNKWKACTTEKIRRKLQHMHLLRLGLHRMSACTLHKAFYEWQVKIAQVREMHPDEGLVFRPHSMKLSLGADAEYSERVEFGSTDQVRSTDPATDLWLLKNHLEAQLSASERMQNALRHENECLQNQIAAVKVEHDAQSQSMVERLNRSYDANIALKQKFDMLQAKIDECTANHEVLELKLIESTQKLQALELENAILLEKMAGKQTQHEKQLQSVLLMADEGFSHSASRDQEVDLLKSLLASERNKNDQLQFRLDASRKMTEETRNSLHKVQDKIKALEAQRDSLDTCTGLSGELLSSNRIDQVSFNKIDANCPIDSLQDSALYYQAEISQTLLPEARDVLKTLTSLEASNTASKSTAQTCRILHMTDRVNDNGENAGIHYAKEIFQLKEDLKNAQSLLQVLRAENTFLRSQRVPGHPSLGVQSTTAHLFILDHLKCCQQALQELTLRLSSQTAAAANGINMTLLAKDLKNWKSDMEILRLEAKLECFQDL